jgi:hypothetical protein
MRSHVAVLLFFPVLAVGWPDKPDAYSQRESMCIGAQDKKCIAELKKECASFGGKWHGETVGRGRQWVVKDRRKMAGNAAPMHLNAKACA